MHLLGLPDELFVMEIFPYLHSTDLIRAFGTLGNSRLVSLIYAHMRHIDLPNEINCLEVPRHYQWDQIRSLQIHEDHLHEAICSIFPLLDQLVVRMSSSPTSSISSCLLSLSNRVTHLRLSFSGFEQVPIVNRVVRDIWHGDSRIARLSTINCILMDEHYFSEISSSLVRNKHLTHLSLIVGNLSSSVPFIALSPVLEHLRIRLTRDAPTWSNPTMYLLERHQWSSRVKSLHVIRYGTFINTQSLCQYIRLFSASLERLAFYAPLIRTYPLGDRRSFDECLLDHLSKLKQLDFCMHTGIVNHECQSRRSFDSWKHRRHVISIFNSRPRYHTRFKWPFVFDRLERVTNDFVDFHSNEARPDFILRLPSITSIGFYAAGPLGLKLISTIKQACPQLRHVTFGITVRFQDDLLEDTQLTLPTVERLGLSEMQIEDHRSLRRLSTLMPHLNDLTVNSETVLHVLDTFTRVDGLRQLTVVESCFCSLPDRAVLAQRLPNTNVLFRKRSRPT